MAESGETTVFLARVDPRGRVLLPAPLRQHLGLRGKGTLVLNIERDGTVRMLSATEAARSGRGLLRRLAPGAGRRSLSRELIEERRAEARGDGGS